MSLQERLYTATEFAAFTRQSAHEARRYELIHGEIVEKMPTEEQAQLAGIFAGEFHLYLKLHPELRARFGVEARFQPAGDDSNVRMPDVFFRYTDAPPVTQGPVIGMPDVAVEIKSPDDTYTAMRAKAAYLERGCRMVLLVYPEKRIVEVYQPDADIQILQIDDVIDGGAVLPGFRLPLRELFKA